MLDTLSTKKVIFVGGKGGVGKTTTAASLAHKLALDGKKVLVISTDPAHSLGDALGRKLNGEIHRVAPNLSALELDIEAISERHFDRIAHQVAQYTKPDMRPKMQQQLELAKDAPGGQEAALLETMCDYLMRFEELGYDHLIFDTAPTGHTLRLLVLPEMMSAWTDGLIAQQKKQHKHKEAAQSFWQRADNQTANPFNQEKQAPWQQALRQLEKRKHLFKHARDRIHDEHFTAIVLVMIPEKLPLYETVRTLEQFEKVNLNCAGVVVNQVIDEQLCEHPFWLQRYQLQQEVLVEIERNIHVPKYRIYLQSEHIVGEEKLQKFLALS
ncbi:ArsA family ATPase [Vibrio aphrogenes]|uniref:ArsA family ATPase n=1 Tax=Vibrio aphrogenes TaxID=1891186 RepID=UPI000B34B9EC|nr:ArsA family ATPase [Vibrio aphrogenes]